MLNLPPPVAAVYYRFQKYIKTTYDEATSNVSSGGGLCVSHRRCGLNGRVADPVEKHARATAPDAASQMTMPNEKQRQGVFPAENGGASAVG
jgi:hypothetical protein